MGWVVTCLLSGGQAMDMQQRRAFVKFVTASVCMPLEENPIIVHPQVALRPGTEDWDKKLPTCRTCANYLCGPLQQHVTTPTLAAGLQHKVDGSQRSWR